MIDLATALETAEPKPPQRKVSNRVSSLLISEIFPPKTGGSGRWFWEIYRRLPRAHVVIAAGEDPRQESFDRMHDLRVTRLPLTLRAWGIRSWEAMRGYWRIFKRLRNLVQVQGVRRVHCARCLPEGVLGLALKHWGRVPYLCYVHGEDVKAASTSRELRWLAARVLRGADFVVPNSRNTEAILRSEWRLHPSRIRLLHPGVDTERFVPATFSPALRARLGWQDRTVLLTVGRLQKRKGHDRMIEALSTIRQAIPNVLYAIVGDGEERSFLREEAARRGLRDCVQFMGEIDDDCLIRCYQQCDLFVLPNRQVGHDIEGFGMVLLEAQACGKPVVAGTSGGTAETMRIPETGRVVDCDAPEELAGVVRELLANPRKRTEMGQAGRRWVVEHFDWETLHREARQLFFHWGGQQPPAVVRASRAG